MNVVYIFADQWRREALGIYNSEIKTPNIDKFAKKSVVFNQAYSTCPVCSPHRACLLTGKYPRSNGVFTNCKTELDVELNENDICISDILKKNGYKTGYIGKWHLDKPDGSGGWDAYTEKGKRRHSFDFWYSYGADDNHDTPHYWNTNGERIDIRDWSPNHETDVAIKYIKENKDNFALFLSYNPPHNPYDKTPNKYKSLYENITIKDNVENGFSHHTGEKDKNSLDNLDDVICDYYGAISGLDYNIGRIFDCLKKIGIYDNTIIVISSDHGDMLGSYGLIGKHVWFEESVGIPFIIGGGGIEHLETNELIGSVDQAPTILGILGIHWETEGKDFSPLLRGEKFEGYHSIMTFGFPNTKERISKFVENEKNPLDYGWRSVVTKDYKLVIFNGYSFGEESKVFLYDKKNMLLEIVTQNNNVKRQLFQEMQYWCEKLGDNFYKVLLN